MSKIKEILISISKLITNVMTQYLSIALSENEIEFSFVSCIKRIYNFKLLIFEM